MKHVKNYFCVHIQRFINTVIISTPKGQDTHIMKIFFTTNMAEVPQPHISNVSPRPFQNLQELAMLEYLLQLSMQIYKIKSIITLLEILLDLLKFNFATA
ncbi:hypothetical protein ACJX0J_032625 [Zea mays]